MRRFAAYVCLLTLLLAACAAPADPDKAQESIQVIAMDTAMLITTYGERSVPAAYAAEDCIRDLEAKLSRTDPDSEVSRLNSAGGEPVDVGEDLEQLLVQALYYRYVTDGAFNINIAPVVSAWGFATGSFQVPAQAELDRLLPLTRTDPELIDFGDGFCLYALEPGQAIDLGAVAKGYTADKLAKVFRENELPRAKAELGGNVLAYGDRPDGAPWRVGVRDPKRPGDPNGFVGVLDLTDSFAVTSGGYQRYFERDGKTYHHIIDPATGYPADSGLASVTVVAPIAPSQGAMCDAYSTALFVMGEDRALDFWRTHRTDEPVRATEDDRKEWLADPRRDHWTESFDLVLVTEDGRVVVTEGLADRFTLDEDSGYVCEAVS